MQLNVHRPAEMCTCDITLFYDFDTFVCECESLSLKKEDTKFATQFSIAMSSHFSAETERNEEIKETLGEYLKGEQLHSVDNTDGAVVCKNYPCLILETKNEVGVGGCDSYLELVDYYIKLLPKSIHPGCPAPCFLIEIIGVHMAIYGAVYTDTVCVDRLTPCLWLAFQPHNHLAMEKVAKTFKALKGALNRLESYYSSFSDADAYQDEVQTVYPVFKTFTDEQNNTHEITYSSKLKDHVFRGKTTDTNVTNVIVKFVEQYSKEAHGILERVDLAPKLLCCQKATSRFYMVVMEDLANAQQLGSYIQNNENLIECKRFLLKQCEEALKELHTNRYCHGDFRGNNILVVPSNNAIGMDIRVIDFDWSGKADEDTYPYFMNHFDLRWHETASDGEVLKPEHDSYWLLQLRESLS